MLDVIRGRKAGLCEIGTESEMSTISYPIFFKKEKNPQTV